MTNISMALMISRRSRLRRFGLYAVLALSIAAAYALLGLRVRHYDTLGYTFLGWNLFLATIPFLISQWIGLRSERRISPLFLGIFFWLIFFPNAPYLVTDLMHLSSESVAPRWYDLALLLAFAWNGLMLGYLSLLDLHQVVEDRAGRIAGWLFSGSAILLGSLGIYVGRFLRWNSWDIFVQPVAILTDVAERLLHPSQNTEIYGVTITFALFLALGYLLLRVLIQSSVMKQHAASKRA